MTQSILYKTPESNGFFNAYKSLFQAMEILILNDPVLFLARIIYDCLTEERVMNSIHEWYLAPLKLLSPVNFNENR